MMQLAILSYYAMTITASAMSGATLTGADVYSQRQDNNEQVLVWPGAPLNQEIVYQTDCVPRLKLLPGSSYPVYGWYRVVVTDSYGRVTERSATTP